MIGVSVLHGPANRKKKQCILNRFFILASYCCELPKSKSTNRTRQAFIREKAVYSMFEHNVMYTTERLYKQNIITYTYQKRAKVRILLVLWLSRVAI